MRWSLAEFGCAGLVVLGFVLRFVALPHWGLVYDGSVYAVMGESFTQHGEFLVPFAPVPTYYHHYPPLYPMYLAAFYDVLGFSAAATKFADMILSALLTAVVFGTTADLFGRRKAWFAAAFVSLEPMFLITTLIGYSESLVGLLFVLTAWAAVKGLRRLPYLALAGLFAGLGFLAKASIGWVFVVALVGGLLWVRRARVAWIFREKWFFVGAGAFALLAGGWTLRNLLRYGWPHWGTSAYLDYVYGYGWDHPLLLSTALLVKLPLFAIFFLLYSGFFLRELRWSRLRARGEETGFLWTLVGVTWVMGWIVSSFFWTVEHTPLWWWDNVRYVVIASPVLLWLALRETEPHDLWRYRQPSTDIRSFTRRFAMLMAVFAAIGLVIVSFPAPYANIAAMDRLDGMLRPGDVVALDGVPAESILPYLSVPNVTLVVFHTGIEAGFLVAARAGPYPGFVQLAAFASGDLVGESFACTLWARS